MDSEGEELDTGSGSGGSADNKTPPSSAVDPSQLLPPCSPPLLPPPPPVSSDAVGKCAAAPCQHSLAYEKACIFGKGHSLSLSPGSQNDGDQVTQRVRVGSSACGL